MKISYINYAKLYPVNTKAFKRWFHVERFWKGQLIVICFRTRAIKLDFRRDWIKDLCA
jgi:hypothetical protein